MSFDNAASYTEVSDEEEIVYDVEDLWYRDDNESFSRQT